MELDDLKRIQLATEKQIEKRKKQARAEALQKMREVAREIGVDFETLMKEHFGVEGKQNSAGGRKKTKVAPKYRHPENPELTWTGRGRQPRWIKEHLESGGNVDDFLIDKT
ncbi:H-NS histone family protein [Roseovarius sp. SCSIO 43702]|nr:H-NS histone family protein [Roseovarius sp. SCSIO 43702]